MSTYTVGPNSDFPSIAAAMQVSGPGDVLRLEAGYGNETATVAFSGMTIFGGASSHNILLNLALGVTTVTLTGNAPIRLHDASDANGIVGNAGNNIVTVTGGIDAVNGGLGIDRLIVDYRGAIGAVTGDSTSSFTEAGGGGRMVTITDGTIEHFTILSGNGTDTITTGAGNDIIKTGQGASTVSAGQGANTIIGGGNADTITALDGGNSVYAGNGANTVTTGNGDDVIYCGVGADTITAGGGSDRITLRGGADSVHAGAGDDRLIIDYTAMTSRVSGGITGGNLLTGYVGHVADRLGSSVDFQGSENFTIMAGSGNDALTTGNGADVLLGNAGNDQLNGGGGRDQLIGGAGSDTLRGGLGADIVTGGAGADVFVFASVAEGSTGFGHDLITDFQIGTDRIALTAIDANLSLAGNQSFDFVGSAQFSSVAGELRYSNGLVTGDVDGDSVADFTINIGVLSGLTQSDFLL
ncbi:calcium-binding protein [Cypionkella psychrotolerans]|uniref:calcium-binding protein n=1 Tax=Cypionkella psychrotolerans TaxID=1678131 RepID=UPI0006B68A28|nr:calcium-binding protein [Cypionkella psychrotolerans]